MATVAESYTLADGDVSEIGHGGVVVRWCGGEMLRWCGGEICGAIAAASAVGG